MASKIIYIVSGRSFSASNPGRKITEVINVWKRLGINVKTYFGKDLNSTYKDVEYGNQKHYDNTLRNNKYLKFFKNSISELKDIIHDRKLYNVIKQEIDDIELIWERSSRLHYSGLRLSKKLNIPFVLEWKDHLINYKFSLFKFYALYIERIKVRNADYIVVESAVLKEELIKQGVLASKIHVALNAVNPREFTRDLIAGQKIREFYNIPEKNIVVGYLGSYAFYHNTINLVYTAASILKQRSDVTFLLVGNGKEYIQCKLLAEKLNILNKGFLMVNGVAKEKVPAILSAINFTILPGSTDIICPIKIMEYMAAETLVYAPNYICNQEVLKSDIGILFEAGNKDDLAVKILNAINNPNLYTDYPKKAKSYVEQNLTWEKTWGQTLLNILDDKKNN